MVEIFDMEGGFECLERKLEVVDDSVKLVAVYGNGGVGKTYFIDNMVSRLEANGKCASGQGVSPVRSSFELIKDYPGILAGTILFHCGWYRSDKVGSNFADDPNVLASEILGREMDVNVLIHGDSVRGNREIASLDYFLKFGTYDIVVFNQH